MPSKLKRRRQRRMREDLIWWRAEAQDWKEVALEHAPKSNYCESR